MFFWRQHSEVGVGDAKHRSIRQKMVFCVCHSRILGLLAYPTDGDPLNSAKAGRSVQAYGRF